MKALGHSSWKKWTYIMFYKQFQDLKDAMALTYEPVKHLGMQIKRPSFTIKKHPLMFFVFLNPHAQHLVLNLGTGLHHQFSRTKLLQHFILCFSYGSISLHLALHLVFAAIIDIHFLDMNCMFHKTYSLVLASFIQIFLM